MHLKNQKILIAEDQPVIAMDYMSLLQKNGYTNISSFLKGKDAIENIILEEPALALLDINLKDKVTGLDIAAILNKLHIPFIFISTFSGNDYQKALKLKPAYIFTKPVNDCILLDAVGEIFILKARKAC